MGEFMSRYTRNSQKKKRDNYDLWVYNGDLNDAMKKFAETQGDSKHSVWARLKELTSNFNM